MFGTGVLTGATARRARSRREMRAAILDVAGRLVEEEGIDALTIRAVAQAIGYSPGAIYEYFESKEVILASLYFDGTDGLGVHCERAITSLPPDASALDAIIAIGHAYRSYALSHPDLYRLVFGGLKTIPTERPEECFEDEAGGGWLTVVATAQRGIEAGELNGPAPMVALTAWASVHGFVSLEITGHLTGSEQPPLPPSDPAQGAALRDAQFAAYLRSILLGMVKEEHRPAAIATVGA